MLVLTTLVKLAGENGHSHLGIATQVQCGADIRLYEPLGWQVSSGNTFEKDEPLPYSCSCSQIAYRQKVLSNPGESLASDRKGKRLGFQMS